MGAGGLAGGAGRQSYRVVAPGWQERAVEKPLREAIIPHIAKVAASRRARCANDIPAVQSGWQARRADPRPDGPPQPHADVARGAPALVGRRQGAHAFRARAVRHASLAAQVDSLVTYRGSIRLFGRVAPEIVY